MGADWTTTLAGELEISPQEPFSCSASVIPVALPLPLSLRGLVLDPKLG